MRISRRRTRYPEHIKREIQREKMKMYRECEQILPLLSDDLCIADPVVANFLIDPAPNPEMLILEKDIFTVMSDEAKALTKIILSCPEEYFLVNGRIKRSLLHKTCRANLGWSRKKTDLTTFEVGLLLQHTI